MSEILNKYITALCHVDRTLLALSGADSAVSPFSFTTAVRTPVGIASTSTSVSCQ